MSKITRRSFIQKAGLFTAGGAAISADLPGYKSNTRMRKFYRSG